MIALLCLVGFGAFIVASTGIGARLLWLARRTGGTAELLLGAVLLASGPLGHGLVMVGRELGPEPGVALTGVVVAGLAGESLAAALLYLFAWRVFRAHQPAARAVFVIAMAVLVTASAVDLSSRIWINLDGRGAAYWVAAAARTLAPIWVAGESFAAFVQARSRGRLGIGPSGSARQALHWALGMGLAGASTGLWLAAHWWTGQSPVQLPAVNAGVSLLALGATLELWRAFRPPSGAGSAGPRSHPARASGVGASAIRG